MMISETKELDLNGWRNWMNDWFSQLGCFDVLNFTTINPDFTYCFTSPLWNTYRKKGRNDVFLYEAHLFFQQTHWPNKIWLNRPAGLVHYLALGLDLHGAPGHLVWNDHDSWIVPWNYGDFFNKKKQPFGWSKEILKDMKHAECCQFKSPKGLGFLCVLLISKSWTCWKITMDVGPHCFFGVGVNLIF